MTARTEIILDEDMQRRAEAKAAELGLTFSQYVQRLLALDLGQSLAAAPTPAREDALYERDPNFDISQIFDLVDEGEPTDIGRDKHKMIGDALWDDYLEKTGRKPRRKKP